MALAAAPEGSAHVIGAWQQFTAATQLGIMWWSGLRESCQFLANLGSTRHDGMDLVLHMLVHANPAVQTGPLCAGPSPLPQA